MRVVHLMENIWSYNVWCCICRNRWGTSWGYSGFGYVQRIDTSSSYPYGNCAIGSAADYITS